MSQTNQNQDLGPLPIADRNRELEQRSITALRVALPSNIFLFRDERTDDAGVDGSLELLIDSLQTNLRAQVQLKSTDSSERNRDGSISLTVKTSNLNYLLNGSSPIYILYIEPLNEIRFVWARDERRRIERENPEWMSQETVTLRFEHILTAAATAQIHERIKQEAQFQRRIHDNLARSSASERVVTSIDPETLAITDPDEARDLLLSAGVTIVSGGNSQAVQHLLKIIGVTDARLPKIKLVQAYAEYATGRFTRALADLSEVELVRDELSADDRQLLIYLQDACAYQTGAIESEEYSRRLQQQTAKATPGIKASHAISNLRVALFAQPDLPHRERILTQMRSAVERVTSDVSVPDGFKLHVQLILLESEGHQSLLTSLDETHSAQLRQALKQDVDIIGLLGAHQRRWSDWEHRSEELLQQAVGLNNPLLVADALGVRVIIRIAHLMHITLLTPLLGVPTKLPADVLLFPRQDAEQAIAIYSSADQLEGEMRVRIALAELLTLGDRREEAEEIAREVLPKAKAMSYAAIEEKAQMILSRNTLPDIYARNAAQAIDSDFRLANESDERVSEFARDILAAYELPLERLPVIVRECESLREIALERLNWCKHIDLTEHLKHLDSKDSAYKLDPPRRCICELHKYESAIESTDWTSVIKAFKKAYCDQCPDRTPKKSDQ